MKTLFLSTLLLVAACGKKAEETAKKATESNIPQLENLTESDNLRHAVEGNDPRSVKTLLRRGINPELLFADGSSLLTYAITHNYASIVEVLLLSGADHGRRDKNGLMPIFAALDMKNPILVRLLVVNGAAINIRDPYERTPLMLAIKAGEEALAKWLIERGAEVDARDSRGRDAVQYAQDNGFPGLANSIRVRIELIIGVTNTDLLRELLEMGDIDGVRFLLGEKSDILQMPMMPSALHLAIEIADVEKAALATNLLLSYNIDPKGSEIDTHPPISHAALLGRIPLMKILIEAGADKNQLDKESLSPLIHAIMEYQEEVVEYLVTLKAKKDYTVKTGNTSVKFEACSFARKAREQAADSVQLDVTEKMMQHLGCGIRWLFFW
jgi:ankyrin repeat protein